MADVEHERIRNRAYEIWEQEGRPEGRDVDHWDKATRDLAGATSDTGPSEASFIERNGTESTDQSSPSPKKESKGEVAPS
ncbi:DUF2934 domain-containing protein [Caulobacter sp. S45]|jgi:hypothetical protein|uniref:DUF2934 domain-containing protein n=1 Tax=Caulobacter sp. S45 TaxID=1641861 RepID=UPI00131E1689